MGVDPQAGVVSEIAELRDSIDRLAAATEVTLAVSVLSVDGEEPIGPAADRRDLARQLVALRDRVAVAESGSHTPRALRAELATLLFFARTLQADAHDWRSTLDQRLEELERQRTAARRERERLLAERDQLVRRRDALQLAIVQTAERMAQHNAGECRRTLPVFTLGEGLTVCSVSVTWPRRRLRAAKHWLVTLDRTRSDVLIRRE